MTQRKKSCAMGLRAKTRKQEIDYDSSNSSIGECFRSVHRDRTVFANLHAATVEKVNASYGAISGSILPIWVAKEGRLFDKHGLDLNLVYISGGPRSIMSLIGGSVQFVNHSGMPALEAHQRGADTAMIASPMNQLEHSLVVQKNITSTEQLRGKVIGISTLGSLTDIRLREGLRLNNISEKDVTILPVGDLGARLRRPSDRPAARRDHRRRANPYRGQNGI